MVSLINLFSVCLSESNQDLLCSHQKLANVKIYSYECKTQLMHISKEKSINCNWL